MLPSQAPVTLLMGMSASELRRPQCPSECVAQDHVESPPTVIDTAANGDKIARHGPVRVASRHHVRGCHPRGGVAAGRHLAASGLDVLLIEATDRIGGRAHTAFHDGLHFHLGCGWLHSADRNGWAVVAPEFGFHIDRTTSPWITGIDASGHALRLTSARGEIEAARVIVTVPTDVLASGAIRLPPRAADHIDAAGALPLGLADKIIFKLSDCDGFEPGTQVLGNPFVKRTASYHLRPFGWPLIEGFVGGEAAREFEADGDAFAAFARDELAGLFGSGIRRRLEPIAQSRWARQPFARGSYSHALPAHAEARVVLAGDVDGRLFFAGEACSMQDFSTAHGALQTGLAIAQNILKARR